MDVDGFYSRRWKYGLSAILIFQAVAILSAAHPPEDRIPLERARHIATRVCPGKIRSSELIMDNGAWIFSFEIQRTDSSEHEIRINAKTGRVIRDENKDEKKMPLTRNEGKET